MKSLFGFVIKIIGLGITGIIFGIAGGLIGASILKGEVAGFGGLVGAIMGLVIGYPLGVIIGIILLNKALHYSGSLTLGITGSILGVFLTIGLAEPLNLNVDPNILFGAFFLSVPLLGMIGFRLRRRAS